MRGRASIKDGYADVKLTVRIIACMPIVQNGQSEMGINMSYFPQTVRLAGLGGVDGVAEKSGTGDATNQRKCLAITTFSWQTCLSAAWRTADPNKFLGAIMRGKSSAERLIYRRRDTKWSVQDMTRKMAANDLRHPSKIWVSADPSTGFWYGVKTNSWR